MPLPAAMIKNRILPPNSWFFRTKDLCVYRFAWNPCFSKKSVKEKTRKKKKEVSLFPELSLIQILLVGFFVVEFFVLSTAHLLRAWVTAQKRVEEEVVSICFGLVDSIVH